MNMGFVESIEILLSISLLMCLLLPIIKFLMKVWWNPLRIQSAMRSQGLTGPSYKFFYGNSKEMLQMRKQSYSRPMSLSDQLFLRIQPHMYTWVNSYGKNYFYWHGPKAHLVVTDSELVREIMNNKDKVYPKMEPSFFLKKLLGDGLVMAEGEKWAKLRRLANHAFRAESLRHMTPAMIESVEMMLERWREYEGKEIEVFQEFKLLTSEVISKTAFGSSYLEGKDIFDMISKLCVIISRNTFKIRLPMLSKFFKSADEKEIDMLEKQISDSIVGMVKKREKLLSEEEDNLETDFLGLLVKANHDANANNRITIEEIVDECKTFYFAGHETTSTLLTWTFLFLAIHTEWQDKARQEVIQVLGQQHPTSESCGKLKTMGMILNESLRLYPPILSFIRRIGKEVKLGNFNLPDNINMIVPVLALHHNTAIWGENALQFKPERFSEGVAKATNGNQTAFVPFGFGPRICVGMNFAVNEAKIAMSMILQRYAFTLSPTYVHSPVVVLTVQPQHGVQVKLHAL